MSEGGLADPGEVIDRGGLDGLGRPGKTAAAVAALVAGE
jgi:hypothetical protein